VPLRVQQRRAAHDFRLARNFHPTATLTAARDAMKHARRLQLGLALLLIAGCGTGKAPAASVTSPSQTPSSIATTSSSPTPPGALCTPSNRCLALVTLRGGTDRVVGTTPGLGVGGCESIASCTLPNWLDSRLTFSADGKFFSFVAQGFGASFMNVWSSDGTLLRTDKSQLTTMSTWSAQS